MYLISAYFDQKAEKIMERCIYQIAEKTGISDMSVRESVEASLKKIKKFPAVRQMRTGISQGNMGKKR